MSNTILFSWNIWEFWYHMYVILALFLRANETNDVYNPNALVRLTDFYNLTDIYNILQGTQYQDI